MDEDLCVCCLLDLDDEQRTFYQHSMDNGWIKAKYCWETIQTVLKSKYKEYMDLIYQSKCRHELDRMLINGPPRWYSDPKALPVPEGAHITHFHRVVNGVPIDISALYEGAPESDEDYKKIWDDVTIKIKERLRLIAIADGRDPNCQDPVEPKGEND
jgi:hypothetical protein